MLSFKTFSFLSYATLANLPPVNGLYASIFPSLTYIILGSSMQLALGPVAIVSSLVGELVTVYGNEPGSQNAVDTASQAALSMGIILFVMGALNMGVLIRFISKPVLVGFTTAAAMLIGVSQLKSAFGFIRQAPQLGSTVDGYEYHYNFEVYGWYLEHWNDRDSNGWLYVNPLATAICFGFFAPCFALVLIKVHYVPTKEMRKRWYYKLLILLNSALPLLAIIIGAHIAWKQKPTFKATPIERHYANQLHVVGYIQPGLNRLLKLPSTPQPFFPFLGATFPLTLIGFMESFAVAHRLAANQNNLDILSENQELYAIGLANLIGSFGSSYPVSGSFSRSALNAASGATTPLSKLTTLALVLLALEFMTPYFYYIPYAALAAVIWITLYNLLQFSDMCVFWVHSKGDFVAALITFVITFVFDTSLGLAAGVGCSVLVYLISVVIYSRPHLSHEKLLSTTRVILDIDQYYLQIPPNCNSVKVIALDADINFLTAPRIKGFLSAINLAPPYSDVSGMTLMERDDDHIFFIVTTAMDASLRAFKTSHKVIAMAPKVCILDMRGVKLVDITGLSRLMEALEEGRKRGIKFLFTGLQESLEVKLASMELVSDISIEEVGDYISLGNEGDENSHMDLGLHEDVYEDASTDGVALRARSSWSTMVSLASSSEFGDEEHKEENKRS